LIAKVKPVNIHWDMGANLPCGFPPPFAMAVVQTSIQEYHNTCPEALILAHQRQYHLKDQEQSDACSSTSS
jgi:hypothetical protein